LYEAHIGPHQPLGFGVVNDLAGFLWLGQDM
jgi:hypothetical protein